MCSASSSTRNASSITTPSIASSKSSGKRDMWTPFCEASRSTAHSISAAISFSRPAWLMRIAFCTPVTPARERPSRTSGSEACRSSVTSFASASMVDAQDTSSFPRLVSLACHDLRTPLATVHGFARTLVRQGELEEQAARWVEMIDAASAQMAELRDELALAARIEARRYDPTLLDADTLELAGRAAEQLGE